MNKPLVIIIFLSIVYILIMALSTNAQRVQCKIAKLEYGYINGISQECNMSQVSENSPAKLHYFVQKGDKKIKVEFFCFDETKSPVNQKLAANK